MEQPSLPFVATEELLEDFASQKIIPKLSSYVDSLPPGVNNRREGVVEKYLYPSIHDTNDFTASTLALLAHGFIDFDDFESAIKNRSTVLLKKSYWKFAALYDADEIEVADQVVIEQIQNSLVAEFDRRGTEI